VSSFLIVGLGAIGGLFGLKLHEAGEDVIFLTRDRQKVEEARKKGVTLVEGKKSKRFKIPVFLAESKKNFSPSWVMLAVKVYDTEKALETSIPMLRGAPFFFTLQNGYEFHILIKKRVGIERLAVGSTSEGAYVENKLRIVHSGKGKTLLSSYDRKAIGRCEELSEILRKAGFETEVVEEPEKILIEKLIISSVINPLTALLGVKNGELLREKTLIPIMEYLVSESLRILRKKGHHLQREEILKKLYEVITNTRMNKSSMLQDLEKGRRTEIDYISGAILKMAKEVNETALLNESLYRLIKFKESISKRESYL